MFGRSEPVEAQVEEQAPLAAEDRAGEEHSGDSPIGRLRPSLASLMVEEGVATSEQLEQALAEGQESGERLGEVVLRHGWINEAGLAGLVARQWDLSFVALSMISVDDRASALLPRETCERLSACPVSFDDGVPLVALADPNEDRFAAVREALGTHCSFFVTTGSALAGLIDQQPSGPDTAPHAEAPAEADHEAPAVEVEVEVEVEAPAPETHHAVAVEHAHDTDDSEPVFDQLDKLLQRLLEDRERNRDELGVYHRQLADLEDQQARVRENIRSLEAKVVEEEHRLDSMRAKLADYAQSLSTQ
jgi:hypothetical protein